KAAITPCKQSTRTNAAPWKAPVEKSFSSLSCQENRQARSSKESCGCKIMVPHCFRWNTARTEVPSPKHQAPEKLQISSSKQKPERCGSHPGLRAGVWLL